MAPTTLKQRLAAISASLPRPSNDASPLSPAGKARAFFKPSLSRRQSDASITSDDYVVGDQSHEKLQEVMSQMIFQAGVDYETRPMVIMNASALPDPREVSYDLLLIRILSYLDLYVEADYTVVFFAAGGRNTPGWNWVWKAYRSLNRKYRKNLKKLYIVHPSFFTKMLFSLAGAIISPKFFKKITYVNTLSDLGGYVPITQIEIPPAVYQENLRHEKQIILPSPTRSELFGVPLEELMGFDGEKGGLPRVVKDCIYCLRKSGMEDEGLFRRSPNGVMLRQVTEAYNRGHVVNLETYRDPHLAAVLLKKYLRDLPQAVFPESLYPVIRRCPGPSDDPTDMAAISYIREVLLPSLPHCSYILLSSVLNLIHDVSLRSAKNRMDAHNLTIVICPNLVSSGNPIEDVAMCAISASTAPLLPASLSHSPPSSAEGKTTLGTVIKLCIERYYEIFDEVPDRSEAIPQRPFEAAPLDPSPSNSPPPTFTRKRDSVTRNRDSISKKRESYTRNRDSMLDDDEEIDDAMLVMPLGPSGSGGVRSAVAAFESSHNGSQGPAPYKTRQRPAAPKEAPTAWSVYTAGAASGTAHGNGAFGTVNKARSTISIEKGNPSRRGSISVGRGTTKKASGAGVEAIGITAAGFFSSPDAAPPVPALPGQNSAAWR